MVYIRCMDPAEHLSMEWEKRLEGGVRSIFGSTKKKGKKTKGSISKDHYHFFFTFFMSRSLMVTSGIFRTVINLILVLVMYP